MNLVSLFKIIVGAAAFPVATAGTAAGVTYGLTPSKTAVLETREATEELKNNLGNNLSSFISGLVKESITNWNRNLDELKDNVKQIEESFGDLLKGSKESLEDQFNKLSQEIDPAVREVRVELETHFKETNQSVSRTESKLNADLKDKSSSLEKKVKGLETKLSGLIEQETKNSDSSFTSYPKRLETRISSIENLYKYVINSTGHCSIIVTDKGEEIERKTLQDFLKDIKDVNFSNLVKSRCFDLKRSGSLTIRQAEVNFYKSKNPTTQSTGN